MPQIIEELKAEDWYRDQIVDHRSFEKKEPQICTPFISTYSTTLGPAHPFVIWCTAQLSTPLPDSIAEGLQKARFITKFYSHQAAAVNAIAEGKHVIVSTATASGKSIIYQVPVLRFLEEDRDSTAIYIYPTKVPAPCFDLGSILKIIPGIGPRSTRCSGSIGSCLSWFGGH